MPNDPFIAVDWGNSNRRAWRIDADDKVDTHYADDRGTLKLKGVGVDAAISELRDAFGDLPMMMVGTIGSADGWGDVGRLSCPVTLDQIASGLVWIEPHRTSIACGLKYESGARVDILRGEDVQILGAVVAGLLPRDAHVCQPGTHSKWATLVDAALVGFSTSMTGEAFALIRSHSLIGEHMGAKAVVGQAFIDAVKDGTSGDLLSKLFGARAAVMLGHMSPDDCASRISGLLIGNEIASHIGREVIYLLASGTLAPLYESAIEALGGTVIVRDCDAAFIAGAIAIWRSIS